VRSAYELGDAAAVTELLDLLDSHRPGELAGIQLAERDLVRARLASGQAGPLATAGFVTAIDALRTKSTPYHLAHGLLDFAEHLSAIGDSSAALVAVADAREIATRLGCQPLLDRADSMAAAAPVT
jgi:hypothetical protein